MPRRFEGCCPTDAFARLALKPGQPWVDRDMSSCPNESSCCQCPPHTLYPCCPLPPRTARRTVPRCRCRRWHLNFPPDRLASLPSGLAPPCESCRCSCP